MNDTHKSDDTTQVEYAEPADEGRHDSDHGSGHDRGSEAMHFQASAADASSRTEPIRPTGISWFTVALGIACLVFATTVLTVQLSDLRVAWSVATPALVVGAGVLLLLAGAAGVVRGRTDEALHLD